MPTNLKQKRNQTVDDIEGARKKKKPNGGTKNDTGNAGKQDKVGLSMSVMQHSLTIIKIQNLPIVGTQENIGGMEGLRRTSRTPQPFAGSLATFEKTTEAIDRHATTKKPMVDTSLLSASAVNPFSPAALAKVSYSYSPKKKPPHLIEPSKTKKAVSKKDKKLLATVPKPKIEDPVGSHQLYGVHSIEIG
jgi:hypothetical protein